MNMGMGSWRNKLLTFGIHFSNSSWIEQDKEAISSSVALPMP